MTPRRSSVPALLLLAAAVALTAGTGCTEKNMGSSGGEGGGGWTRVETQSKPSAPATPLAHADAVNVTYFYLPG